MCRIALLFLFSVILAGCSREAPHHADHKKSDSNEHAGHATAKLMVQTDPSPVESGKPVKLKLMIHDSDGAMVKKFDVIHEEKVHLIIVRDGLDQFAHLHPAVDAAGNLTVAHTFPTGGLYRLYADHQRTGGNQATAMSDLKVLGETPPSPTLTPDTPGKVKGNGLDGEVTLKNVKAGSEATIRFQLTETAGNSVADLQPYMGAMGHLVVLSSDGKDYVHAHPAEDKEAKNVVVFQAHFMNAGLYKGWGQFRWKGEVRVIPFVMKVE